jgi:hypothetical protein
MSQKRPSLDEQVHFPPFHAPDGNKYDLSHLDADIVEYIHKAPEGKVGARDITYTFYITYSMHCFAKDYPHLTDEYRRLWAYKAIKEIRPFCKRRYSLSMQLPAVIKNLPQELTFHSGHESFAVCSMKDDDGRQVEYYVSFSAYREHKKLRFHVMSAYPLDKPLGRVKKVNLFAIAQKLLAKKPLPKP